MIHFWIWYAFMMSLIIYVGIFGLSRKVKIQYRDVIWFVLGYVALWLQPYK